MYQQFALHPFVFISLTQYECLFFATECPGFTFGFTGARSGIGPVEPTRPKKGWHFVQLVADKEQLSSSVSRRL